MAFLAAVRGEGPVVCTGEDGREAVRLILSAYSSAASGLPVAMTST
jgi:predicted dehydrogenase